MDRTIETVLKSVFYLKDTEFQQEEIRKDVVETVYEKVSNKYSGYGYKFTLFDHDKKRWKASEHFVKKFPIEIEYAKKAYGISKNEISFLCLLESYLLWEWNLIIDPEDDNRPMTQSMITDKLEIDIKTANRMLTILVQKNMLCDIPIGKEKYYIVNPHVMFMGRSIHKDLDKMFVDAGYITRYEYEKSLAKKNRNIDK